MSERGPRGRGRTCNTAQVSGSAGFTLAEVVAVLAIITILAGVVAGSALAVIDRARIRAAAESLENLADAAVAFQKDVGNFPLNISQLAVPITTASLNSCSAPYTAGQRARWRGPYLPQLVDGNGIDLGLGAAPDVMFRAGEFIVIPVVDVDVRDAEALDEYLDSGNGASDGAVRWITSAGELVGLGYLIPTSGC